MKNARNSTMNGAVNMNPARPWRSPRALRRPPGTRFAVTEVTVASLMSLGPRRPAARPRSRGRAASGLLACDRQALLLGVVDDGIPPRLERGRGALALVDRFALDVIALGGDVLVDRRPLPALVHQVRHVGVDL